MPTTPAGTTLRQWFRPPRHLFVLFLGTTLGFWIGLGWLAWYSLEQERQLEAERQRSGRELATETIAAEIRRNVANIELQLERLAGLPQAELVDALSAFGLLLPADAVVVTFEGGTVQAFPRSRMLYYPDPAGEPPYLSPLPSRAYALLSTDPDGAVEIFAAFARTGDEQARAEALLGLARAQARLGRIDASLTTYGELVHPDVLVHGRPAELLARVARCELLAARGRRKELAEESTRLARDLHSGRWRLTRASYTHYSNTAQQLLAQAGPLPRDVGPHATAVPIADAVAELWAQRGQAWASPVSGQTSRVFGDQPVLLAWHRTHERVVAIVAGPGYVGELVLGPLRAMLDQQRLRVVLEDSDGRPVLSHGSSGPDAEGALRTSADTRLPWTLRVTSDAATSPAQLSGRRLIIAGLAFLALFVVAGSYFSIRAITREVEAARLKSDFVAAVSHEFRTPLTLLRQFSDLLADDRVSGEQERRHYYAALQRGTRRLTRLVEDLLDFGRMEAGSRAFALQPVRAHGCVESVAREFQEEVRNRGYSIDVAWDAPEGVIVQADEPAIGRALWNLLDNAVKYSPGCRTVWVRGRLDDGRLAIDVRDRGLGVSSHEHRAIFSKFVRGSASGRSEIKGTGLGLALVEQIVEAHGGTVRLESVVGEGSTFTIVLPATVEEQMREQRAWRAS